MMFKETHYKERPSAFIFVVCIRNLASEHFKEHSRLLIWVVDCWIPIEKTNWQKFNLCYSTINNWNWRTKQQQVTARLILKTILIFKCRSVFFFVLAAIIPTLFSQICFDEFKRKHVICDRKPLLGKRHFISVKCFMTHCASDTWHSVNFFKHISWAMLISSQKWHEDNVLQSELFADCKRLRQWPKFVLSTLSVRSQDSFCP